jgi:uncharacterized protein YgfB (UPF0149 family)
MSKKEYKSTVSHRKGESEMQLTPAETHLVLWGTIAVGFVIAKLIVVVHAQVQEFLAGPREEVRRFGSPR